MLRLITEYRLIARQQRRPQGIEWRGIAPEGSPCRRGSDDGAPVSVSSGEGLHGSCGPGPFVSHDGLVAVHS
jgi:hypothetical protein